MISWTTSGEERPGPGSAPGTRALLALAALIGLAGATSAIVVRHDVANEAYDCDERCPDATAYFHLGGRFGAGTGTLIAPRWVLTAAHVAEHVEPGDRVTIAGEPHRIEAVHSHPQAAWDDGFVDVALIQLGDALEGVRPAAVNADEQESGAVVRFVGAGRTGNGRDGLGATDRRRRHAENRVERTWDHWLEFRFDAPADGRALPLEGISGPGDSGGPAYRVDESDDSPCLLGVSSWQNNQAQDNVEGVYGVLEQYVRTSSVIGWIEATVDREGFPRRCD